MPLSLKLPDGFMPFVLQMQLAAAEADELGHGRGVLQQRLPFADGDHLLGRGERQQLAKPPDAAEAERVEPPRPLRLEGGERLRNRQAVPVVGHVEQVAAA